MCGPRQLFFFQRGPEMPKGWTPLLDYPTLMPSLCCGLSHHCNASPLANLNSVTMSHVNQGRSEVKIISSLPNHFSPRIPTKECRNTSPPWMFSSTYIIFLLPLKIQRGTQITVLLPPLLLLCPLPSQAGMHVFFSGCKFIAEGFGEMLAVTLRNG